MQTPRDDAVVELLYRYRFAGVEYNEADGSLQVEGVAATLERRPLDLLAALLRQPGVVLTKTELLANLWGRDEASLSDNALANAVSKLRESLGSAGSCVKNVRGVGYRLDAHVERTVLSKRIDAGPLALRSGMPVPLRESFVLDRPLGRSPRQEVWLAHQPRAGHARVFKFCADGERLNALKREFTLHRLLRKTLGERPEFTHVTDANFAEAPYWLECEVGGQDLAEWSEAPPAFGGLDRAQRLALFLGVARAVALAHGVGVLHKDLKPGNVLVYRGDDGNWAVRLTDFGSGRVLDAAALDQLGLTAMGLTVTGGVASDSGSATIFYLAPEVLRGHAPTVQTDLYALGLMLFQLLVGDFRRPMAPGWEEDIDDPLLREDLAAATHSQPEARLKTVAEWADRLARLPERRAERAQQAAAEQVAAASAARWERSRARRPFVIAAFASLAIGLGASLWFFGQARTALDQARNESARALAINEFLNQDVLQSADVSQAGNTRQVTMVAVLARASARAAGRFEGQPLTEAGVRQQLAQIAQNTGSLDVAEKELARALDLLQALPPHAAAEELHATRLQQVRLLAKQSKIDEAAALLDAEERSLGEARLAGEDRLAFLATAARFAMLTARQQHAAARPSGERLLLLAEKLYARDLGLQVRARRELAEVYNRLGEYDRAIALLEAALRPPFSAETIGEASQAGVQVGLARIQVAAGHNPEAEQLLLRARETLLRAFGPNDYGVATATLELGNLYSSEGRFEEALAQTKEAHRAMQASLGDDHQATRILAMNLALMSMQTGHGNEALALLDQGRPWFVQKFGDEQHPVVQGIDYYRASLWIDRGQAAKASALLQTLRPEALAQSSPAPDWPHRLAGQRGRALVALGHKAEGGRQLHDAIAAMQKLGTAAWMVAPMQASLRESGFRAGE